VIVKIPDVGRGVNYDLSPDELLVGAWSDVQNMRFSNGYAQKFKGLRQVFADTTVPAYHLAHYETPTAKYWIHAGTARVFADDGTTRTEITPAAPFTGGIDDRWSACVFGGVLVMNNAIDPPQFWGGNPANKLAALTGWNTAWRADVVVPFKSHLVALNVLKTATRFSSMVKWSHSAVPGSLPTSWDETDVTKDAGENDLAETTDALIDALHLGDSLILYKERSMYSMTFIGQPFIFRFARIPGSVGMLRRGCGVVTPAGHVVLTAGDVVLYDGQQTTSIADGQVRRFIFDSIDGANYKKAFVTKSLKDNEVLICLPTDSGCNKAAVWNWQTKAWGVRDLPSVTYGAEGQLAQGVTEVWSNDSDTWNQDDTTWGQESELEPNEDRLLLCTTSKIAAFDVGTKDLGAVMPSKLERTGLSFDEPAGVKLFRGVWPRIDAPSGTVVNISIGASMTPNGAPAWGAPVPFTVGEDVKTDAFAQGRYLALRIESEGFYRVRSVNLDIVPTGGF
jgi:hypothetical protein